MITRLHRKKTLLSVLVLTGIFMLLVCHSSAMAMSAESMDCSVEHFCGICAAPLNSHAPELQHHFTPVQNIPVLLAQLPIPHLDPLYHPPR